MTNEDKATITRDIAHLLMLSFLMHSGTQIERCAEMTVSVALDIAKTVGIKGSEINAITSAAAQGQPFLTLSDDLKPCDPEGNVITDDEEEE